MLKPLYLVPCIFALLLSSCGFHLREPVALPESMGRIQLQGTDPYGELAYEFRDALADAGAQAVAGGEPAGAVIEVSGERFQRLVASVDSQGRATQYELRYSLAGSLREPGGAERVPVQNVVVRKLLNTNADNALGTASEEEMLQREMRRDAVRRLLRQLRTVLGHEPRP